MEEYSHPRKEIRATLFIQEIGLFLSDSWQLDLKASNNDLFVVGVVEHQANLMITEVLKVQRNKVNTACLRFKSSLVVKKLKHNFNVTLKFFVMQQKSTIKKSNSIVDWLKSFKKWFHKDDSVAENQAKLAEALLWKEIDNTTLDNVQPLTSDFKLLGDVNLNLSNFCYSSLPLTHMNVLMPFKNVIYIDAELSHQS